jgi:hypothetical protein
MASTRNINTPVNYSLQQNEFRQFENYTLYPNSQYGEAYNPQFAGIGLLPAQMPANNLSYNPVNTESFLFGINSTNLVNPAPTFTPEIKYLKSANVFELKPTFIPEPLVVEKNQRPFPIPN